MHTAAHLTALVIILALGAILLDRSRQDADLRRHLDGQIKTINDERSQHERNLLDEIGSRNRRISDDTIRIKTLQQELATLQRQVALAERSRAASEVRLQEFLSTIKECELHVTPEQVTRQALVGQVERIEPAGGGIYNVLLKNRLQVVTEVPQEQQRAWLAVTKATPGN